MVRHHQRPRRKTGHGLGLPIDLDKKPGRPPKERVETNNPSLQGEFINKKRKEGGGAVLEVVDEDATVTTHIIEPRSSQITHMDLEEHGQMVKIETENRYGKKETSFITQTPHDINLEYHAKQGKMFDDIKDKDVSQLKERYSLADLRSFADTYGIKSTARKDERKDLIQKLKKRFKSNPRLEAKIADKQSEHEKLQQSAKNLQFESQVMSDAEIRDRLNDYNNRELEQYFGYLVEPSDKRYFKDNSELARQAIIRGMRKSNQNNQIGSDQVMKNYKFKINDASTKEQLEKIRESVITSKHTLNEQELEELNRHWNSKWKYLQDLESDRDGQKYINEIKMAKTERDLELVKRQIANNKTFNPTEGQIETLNTAFEKKSQDIIDNKKDEKQLTQEMEDLLSNKQELRYRNLSGKSEESFRKQFKQGYIPPYRKGAGATTYYKDDIEYYFYTEPATGVIKYTGAENRLTRQPVNLTIPEVQKKLGWERITIEQMGY